MLEAQYQRELIKTLKEIFPGCVVLKNDTDYIQGFPDLLILYQNHWAALEVKPSQNYKVQPNQDYYLDTLNDMSFASVIFPEAETEVLDALQQAFGFSRPTRYSRT